MGAGPHAAQPEGDVLTQGHRLRGGGLDLRLAGLELRVLPG